MNECNRALAAPGELSERERRFMENLRAVHVGDREMRVWEMRCINAASNGDWFDAAVDFFRLGYRRGLAVAKAELKLQAAGS